MGKPLHRILRAATLVLTTAWLLTSCSTVAVRTKPGSVTKEGIESADILKRLSKNHEADIHIVGSSAFTALESAKKLERQGEDEAAAASYLISAVGAWEALASSEIQGTPEEKVALVDVHNLSLARFAELWSRDPRKVEDRPRFFSHEGKTFEITLSPNSEFSATFFDEVVSAESIRGKGVVNKEREGLGAALVGIREQTPERADELRFYSDRGMHTPVTMVIEPPRYVANEGGDHLVVPISLLDPMARETVTVGDESYPLAANYSAPMEMLLSGKNEIIWGLKSFINAEARLDESGIYLFEPYDPDRIPVVLTHGLVSVPIIWRDLIPEFMSEPEIATKYQFMIFTYPSSLTIPESALLFRQELALLRDTYDPYGHDPLTKNMVAMGHSMGGILTRLLVTEIGDNLWNEISEQPIDSLGLSPAMEEEARALVFFEADPAVRRAVFMSAPHRGASLADTRLATLASRLARLPVDAITSTVGVLENVAFSSSGKKKPKKFTSVQSLRPDSPVLQALAKSEFKSGVSYHSIIGDRGKGDTPDSSDGVVEYSSSHLEGAESELIVPTGHTTYTDPGAVMELNRILRKHLQAP